MTRSKFFRSNGVLTGFSLSGHSGAGEAGEDIVCAAVSSAAYMTANTLTDVYRFPAAVRAEDGRMTVELSEGDAARCLRGSATSRHGPRRCSSCGLTISLRCF